MTLMPPSAFMSSFTRREVTCGLAALTIPAAALGQLAPPVHMLRVSGGTPPTMTLDGASGPPVLRTRRGQQLAVRLVNDWSEPLAIHWHGVRLINGMDGVPHLTQKPVGRGESFDYRFTPPDAGTFMFRPYPATAPVSGLAGILAVDDTANVDVDREAVILLTGQEKAVHDLVARAHERVRVRLANGGRQPVGLKALLPVSVCAIDGQPCEVFQPRDGIVALAPGNRMDVFLDVGVAPGASATLLTDAASGAKVATLTCESGAPGRSASRTTPLTLPASALPERMNFTGALRSELVLVDTLAGGPKFTAKRGRTVMLALRNPSERACVAHLHGHSARLLDRLDDGWKPFWMDTFFVAAGQTVRIAFVADNPGKWAIDVTAPGQAQDRMAWFEVT